MELDLSKFSDGASLFFPSSLPSLLNLSPSAQPKDHPSVRQSTARRPQVAANCYLMD